MRSLLGVVLENRGVVSLEVSGLDMGCCYFEGGGVGCVGFERMGGV